MYQLKDRSTFAFSAENPTGTRNGGTRGKDCEKLNPCLLVKEGDTVTLCEVDGPGMITHLWFTGYIGHSFILGSTGRVLIFPVWKRRSPHFSDADMMRILPMPKAGIRF